MAWGLQHPTNVFIINVSVTPYDNLSFALDKEAEKPSNGLLSAYNEICEDEIELV